MARLGGDEFAVLLTDIEGPESAGRIAADLSTRLREPVVVDSVRLGVQASVGIAIAPQDADSFETLLKRADIALYRAKSNRGEIQSYRPEIDGYTIERLSLLGDLHSAVDNDEFVLAFQPQVCARTGDVLSVEALSRWLHPRHGLVNPDVFIPLAENSGLISRLSRWGIEQAVATLRRLARPSATTSRWPSTSRPGCSPTSTCRPSSARCWQRHGVPATRLTVEVTESTIMADPKRALEVLGSLARDRRQPGDRRLRHRLLLAVLPAPDRGRRAEDRQVVRHADGAGRQQRDHRAVHDRARAQPRAHRHRRGRRGPRDLRDPASGWAATGCRASTTAGRCRPAAIEAWLNERRLIAAERLSERLLERLDRSVIIPLMGLLAVLSPVLAGGRLRRLAEVRFRAHLGPARRPRRPGGGDRGAARGQPRRALRRAPRDVRRRRRFVWLNRRDPRALVVALGAASNGVTIALNGGTLPASQSALETGRAPPRRRGSSSTPASWSTRTSASSATSSRSPPASRCPTCSRWATSLIVLGVAWGAHRVCGSRLVAPWQRPRAGGSRGYPRHGAGTGGRAPLGAAT